MKQDHRAPGESIWDAFAYLGFLVFLGGVGFVVYWVVSHLKWVW